MQIGSSMWPRPQYTDLTYMGGTGSSEPMRIIFDTVIKGGCTSLNIKFDANRTFHAPKSPVYRFDYYGRYQTLWTDEDNFWWCYLELVYKPKYKNWCKSDVLCAHLCTLNLNQFLNSVNVTAVILYCLNFSSTIYLYLYHLQYL